jgi:hypothetical protein
MDEEGCSIRVPRRPQVELIDASGGRLPVFLGHLKKVAKSIRVSSRFSGGWQHACFWNDAAPGMPVYSFELIFWV